MKRIYTALVVFFVCPFFAAISPVHAASPTPVAPTLLPAIPIPNGEINVLKTTEHGPEVTPAPGASVPLTVPGESSGSKFKIPIELGAISTWMNNASTFFLPNAFKDITKEHQTNLTFSGRERLCVYDPDGKLVHEEEGAPFLTETVDYLSRFHAPLGYLSSMMARNALSLSNDGYYDFRGPNYRTDVAPACGATSQGKDQKPTEVAVNSPFNLLAWFTNVFSTKKYRRELVGKTTVATMDEIHCQLNGCINNGADVSYLQNPTKEKRLSESGGIGDTFRTIDQDTTKGELLAGQADNTFQKTNFSYTNHIVNTGKFVKCNLLSKQIRGSLGLTDEDCSDFVTEPPLSCDELLKNVQLNPSQYSGFSSSNDATLGFSIPMHKTDCKITDIEAVAQFAKQWANKQEGYDNVKKYYKTIEEYAVKAGWNPSFLVALWIEETAAGSVGSFEMGCSYDFGIPGSADPSVCGQLKCLFAYPVRNSTYDMLCSYGGKGGPGCTTFMIDSGKNDNRCFPSNVRGSYQEVVNRGKVGTGCAPAGMTSALFQQDCRAKVPGGSIFDR